VSALIGVAIAIVLVIIIVAAIYIYWKRRQGPDHPGVFRRLVKKGMFLDCACAVNKLNTLRIKKI